ncbi:hypothetical protein F9278_20620 [Streptomyces phaeolivaceus]|uniref:Uncharacterized protein n=1 Tax=Streptomyces phaeolivaceus TaxID=2653200 RepID=A0A5P8K5C2_9ACTN|nr:hypothetical protein [Streptomyces phaeolivaceus]QFQ98210.1 hypothetical protein F9278_20620 [Streptomyces phaeolivaceus]
MGLNEAHAPPPGPAPVRATFDAWLDHVLVCDDCRRTPARHCYHATRLDDRHHEAMVAARASRSRGQRL